MEKQRYVTSSHVQYTLLDLDLVTSMKRSVRCNKMEIQEKSHNLYILIVIESRSSATPSHSKTFALNAVDDDEEEDENYDEDDDDDGKRFCP